MLKLTKEFVAAHLVYCPDTGVFTHRFDKPGFKAGTVAGSRTRHGYVAIRLDYVQYKAHRLAWVYVNGEIPEGLLLDHINRDKGDNRIANLRLVTAEQNAQNRSLSARNKTGFTGVCRRPASGRYRASVASGGKRVDLGAFETVEAAAAAYAEAALLVHSHSHLYSQEKCEVAK